MVYDIMRRYEYWGREGKTWTSWFHHESFDTKSEAEEEYNRLKKKKEPAKNLKGEYKIVEKDD